MKKLTPLFLIGCMVFLSFGCSDDSTSANTGTNLSKQELSKRTFVWKAMNSWYYWQKNVPQLADSMAYFNGSEEKFDNYLASFKNAQALYEDLQYDAEDQFSFFIPNLKDFKQSQKGISKSFGYEYGLVRYTQKKLFGYVQYVVPNPKSPAKKAGLKRGDIFSKVNGKQLTIDNYSSLLQGQDSYELSMADYKNNTITPTNKTVSLQKVKLQEDPVFTHEVIDTSGKKVGYLKYNAFQTNSHSELNDVFGTFKNKNIDDLVLDLRYNLGGAVLTSTTLASMISGLDTTKVYVSFNYNSHHANRNSSTFFYNNLPATTSEGSKGAPINSVAIKHLYILTDQNTASASELIINGLVPYMDVTIIGQRTIGKDEASLTFSQNPDMPENNEIAIQPIVIKDQNKYGQQFPNGFAPDYLMREINYLPDLPALGDPNEPLLAKALALITAHPSMAKAKPKHAFHGHFFKSSKEMDPYKGGMYLLPQQLPNGHKLNIK